jgi:thiol-disulfide isomerase/thioredoxin
MSGFPKTSLLLLVSLLLLFSFQQVFSLIEAPDGSVCFNGCSGHGECVDYSCHCFTGYEGDDCSTTFVDDESNIIPILSAGHGNITRQNFTDVVSKNPFIIIGFSSPACSKCIRAEIEYYKLSEELKKKGILFVRGNADKMKSVVLELGATDLPSLVFMKKMRPTVYKGAHNYEPVLQYVNKVTASSPVVKLSSLEEIENFKELRNNKSYSLSTVIVIGLFSDYKDIEEDEYQEFLEIAKELQNNEDIYFGIVNNNKTLISYLKKNHIIDRTPSVYIIARDTNIPYTINLDELYGEKGGLKEWILSHSVPLVGRMTPMNFLLYEKLKIPMLLMFLNLTNEVDYSRSPGIIIGGRSGGILNEILIDELKFAAKEHIGRIVCVYLDGTLYEDQMKLLGLYGGKERLPSLAFNTRDGAKIPFPEELPINSDTLLQFMANFISGKLKNADDVKEMAKRALQKITPINMKNKAIRQEKKSIPEIKQGISEQFGDGLKGDRAVYQITNKNFDEIILQDDSKDIVLLLYAKNCEPCSHFNVYYKRMADRFRELEITSLLIARMDVGEETPPPHMNMINGQLPLVLMIPANMKYPPWTYFSGVGKVQPMMKWVHEHASIPFELENLPHLSDKDKKAYKEQVREREEALEEKRKEEKRLMDQEERERKEILRKRRKAEKAKLQEEQQVSEKVTEVLEDDQKDQDPVDSFKDERQASSKITLPNSDEF